VARLSLRLVLFCALVASAFAASTTSADAGLIPSLLGGNCGSMSKVFAPWGDYAPYYFAPNGGFESGAQGWTLTGGAQVVAGNEGYFVHSTGDGYSLSIPNGATVTSPALCSGVTYKGLRFFAVAPGGSATIHVRVIARGLLSILAVLDGGNIQVGSKWQPTPVSTLLTGLSELVGVKSIQIQLTASGNVQIDDLYVDPLLQEA
jgi:hypothetical protein